MRVGAVQTIRLVDEFWLVTITDVVTEVSTGQFVEQLRGTESLMVWEIVGEKDLELIFSPTGSNVSPNGFPVPTSNQPDLRHGDTLDMCAGAFSRLGLGDVVARVTKALGIKPCASCEERRKKLNRLFPL